MEKVKDAVGFKGIAAGIRRFPAHRSALQAGHARRRCATPSSRSTGASARSSAATSRRSRSRRSRSGPTPPYREKTSAGGEYEQGTPDGSRPGIFYYNSYDLPSRYTWGYETLFLHEGRPGHHFQISLAQENTALPAFQRFGGNTAYVEGWALYSESLGYELGFYTDPYQNYGHLNDEILRAMRLVVDTGIHSMGWSRDQSINYMLDNQRDESKTDATAEVERYIAIPGQALAYKVGQLTIRRLRTKAEHGAGPEVRRPRVPRPGADVRRAADGGAREKIDDWIAATKRT